MTRFIKVADENGTYDFINLDQVVKVSCGVARKKTGGGLNIESVMGPTVPATSPVSETIKATICLFTANGTGNIYFDDLGEAASWVKLNLDIEVPFDQF